MKKSSQVIRLRKGIKFLKVNQQKFINSKMKMKDYESWKILENELLHYESNYINEDLEGEILLEEDYSEIQEYYELIYALESALDDNYRINCLKELIKFLKE